MRKLALGLIFAASPAFGADLPVKVPAPIVVATAYNPFYVGLQGGMGFTRDENELAVPGLAVGVPKQYPTAPSVGAVVGYINTTGALAWGGEIFADYNFSAQNMNCNATTGVGLCTSKSRNSFAFGEDLLVGFTLGQMITASPTSVQPQNWKIPITVPSSIMNNLMILGSVGGAQRTVSLCALDAGTMDWLCGNQWMGGLSVGGQLRFMAAGQWDVGIKYHHNFYNHTFTPEQSVPLFTNSVGVKGEDVFKAGINYHL